MSALRHYLNEAGKYNPQRLPVSFVGIVELRKHHKLDNPNSSSIMKKACFQNVTAIHSYSESTVGLFIFYYVSFRTLIPNI